MNIESFGLWADPQTAGQGVKNFNLYADDNAAFSSPTLLGSYVAVDGLGNANNFAQVFGFASTPASFVRMEIQSNRGSPNITGMVEAAFEVSAVPEPSTCALILAGGLVGAMAGRRKLV